ncbi:unnamed protein product [Dovyalis caffra]|uniref:Uncharacterized protein n=1 Tax=Dovyalis caffra TaxID=77055 RepID=A0AAV1QPB5_9ROSI|nr:unnamed protein product [Dovyalis caffra]
MVQVGQIFMRMDRYRSVDNGQFTCPGGNLLPNHMNNCLMLCRLSHLQLPEPMQSTKILHPSRLYKSKKAPS